MNASKPMRILVVDDERGLRDMLTRGLSTWGHEVVAAADGLQAVGEAQRRRFDVVLCDMMMPGIGGKETMLRLKALQPGLPVVMATGYPNSESEREVLADGAYAYLAKPYDLNDIESVLANAASGTKVVNKEQ